MCLLGQFSMDGVEIIQENEADLRNTKEVLGELEKGKANASEYVSMDELKGELKKVIESNEHKNHTS
jgi:hypothetical protein